MVTSLVNFVLPNFLVSGVPTLALSKSGSRSRVIPSSQPVTQAPVDSIIACIVQPLGRFCKFFLAKDGVKLVLEFQKSTTYLAYRKNNQRRDAFCLVFRFETKPLISGAVLFVWFFISRQKTQSAERCFLSRFSFQDKNCSSGG